MDVFSRIINKFSLITHIPIFRNLNVFELHYVASKSILVEYRKGECIYREGDEPDAFYCLISGRLRAYTLRPDTGKQETVEMIYRGMHFGIISLLTGEKHSLTFEAINDSLILKISRDDFKGILKQIPRLGVELSHSLSQRIKKQESPTKSIFESTVISVYSPSVYAGSSTYAVNLAVSLSRETGKKVIFVNISPVVCVSEEGAYSSPYKDTSPNWQGGVVGLNEIARDPIGRVISGVLPADILNVSIDPADSESSARISQFVSFLASRYHFVVVDLPNRFGTAVMHVLTQSDLIHIISRDSTADIRETKNMILNLKDSLGDGFRSERVTILVASGQDSAYQRCRELTKVFSHSVYATLPLIRLEHLSDKIVSEAMTVTLPHPESEYARIVRRVAREVGGVLVGLVLGSGAALGFSHIGVLKVIEEEKIPIDIVVGCSMGAILGALWVTGRSADQIAEFAREFRTKRLSLKLVDVIISKAGLIGGRNIRRWLISKFGDKTFHDTTIPFKAVAYDLVKREELVIADGPLVDALMQGILIPGVMKPIAREDKLIIDGGIANPLPTNVLARLGIKKIIAVNVFQSPEDVCRSCDVAQQRSQAELRISFLQHPLRHVSMRACCFLRKAFYPNTVDLIIRSLQAMEYNLAQQGAQQADITMHPDVAGIDWFEFYKVDDLIRRGQEAARAELSALHALIAE